MTQLPTDTRNGWLDMRPGGFGFPIRFQRIRALEAGCEFIELTLTLPLCVMDGWPLTPRFMVCFLAPYQQGEAPKHSVISLAALKIHVSPFTQKMLAEHYPSFELELRGEVDMKVQ